MNRRALLASSVLFPVAAAIPRYRGMAAAPRAGMSRAELNEEFRRISAKLHDAMREWVANEDSMITVTRAANNDIEKIEFYPNRPEKYKC